LTTKLGEKRGKSRLYRVDKYQEYGRTLSSERVLKSRGGVVTGVGVLAERPRPHVFLLVPLGSGPPTLVIKLSIQATGTEIGKIFLSTWNIESKCYNRVQY
jgi:hypothetical protein